MKSITVSLVRHSHASANELFEVVKDSSLWPCFTDAKSLVMERYGDDDPHGVGAVRRASATVNGVRIDAVEEIVEVIPDQRIAYVALEGPLKPYKGAMDLESLVQGGTLIRWTSEFEIADPAEEAMWRGFVELIQRTAVRQIILRAESAPLRAQQARRAAA